MPESGRVSLLVCISIIMQFILLLYPSGQSMADLCPWPVGHAVIWMCCKDSGRCMQDTALLCGLILTECCGSLLCCSVSLGYLWLDAQRSLVRHWGSAQFWDDGWRLGSSRQHQRTGNRLLPWWLRHRQRLPSPSWRGVFEPGPVTTSSSRGLPWPIRSPPTLAASLNGKYSQPWLQETATLPPEPIPPSPPVPQWDGHRRISDWEWI